jgi:hypothetical protein
MGLRLKLQTLGKMRHKNIARLWCCCDIGTNGRKLERFVAEQQGIGRQRLSLFTLGFSNFL